MDGFVARRAVFGRGKMDDGAIAGTVVGVVAAVGLLVFCLYPVIVHRMKRRRRANRSLLDAEAGALPDGLPGAGPGYHPHLSSSDSFKQDGELSRGHVGAARGKEVDWTFQHGGTLCAEDAHGAARPVSTEGLPDASLAAAQTPPDEFELQSSPPFYVGEYMPESEVHDDNPGVLKGTSADYYSPSIPSSAFGMVTAPPDPYVDTSRAGRSGSRSSSFRYNVKHMFRRQSDRDHTVASPAAAAAGASDGQPTSADASGLDDAAALQQGVTSKGFTESPTEVMAMPAAQLARTSALPTNPPFVSPPPSSARGPPQPQPPQAQQAEPSFKTSSSPPKYPAPGTVNPMDIMPPCTESEVWHWTERQLIVSSCGPPEAAATPPEHHQANTEYTPVVTSPSPSAVTHAQPAHTTYSPSATEVPVHVKEERAQDHGGSMACTDSHHRLSQSMAPESSRHPSYPSEDSTPFFHRPGSTDLSSHNTPSTQTYGPTPESMNSSDFRYSFSPPAGVVSVSFRAGTFRCHEPGCHQVFDQPHKLKHHQRYHSKDHKCPYANCAKGFGTKTHLQRHINDRHEKKKKFHCSVHGCDYARGGGKAFPRKDNWKRHMTKIHDMDQAQLPEPEEVDHDMSGT